MTKQITRHFVQEKEKKCISREGGGIKFIIKPNYVFILITKNDYSEKDVKKLFAGMFDLRNPLVVKESDHHFKIKISFKNIVIPESFITEQKLKSNLTKPLHKKKGEEKIVPKESRNQERIKKAARCGISIDESDVGLVSSFGFQSPLFSRLKKSRFRINEDVILPQVVHSIDSNTSFQEKIILAEALLVRAGLAYTSFKQKICDRDFRHPNGRSYPIEFGTKTLTASAKKFLEKFFVVAPCDTNRIFIVNEVPFGEITKFLFSEFKISERGSEDQYYRSKLSKRELHFFGINTSKVASLLKDRFPGVHFDQKVNVITYSLKGSD